MEGGGEDGGVGVGIEGAMKRKRRMRGARDDFPPADVDRKQRYRQRHSEVKVGGGEQRMDAPPPKVATS